MANASEESKCVDELTQEEAFRYSRQMILPEIGREGEVGCLEGFPNPVIPSMLSLSIT